MTKKPAKKAVKKSGPKSGVVLAVQPHGGAIRVGSLPGNTPGTGRPPDAIRAAMRDKLEVALPNLWTQYEAGSIDALGFANFLAKYGLGSKELVIASPDAAAFFDCVHKALVEIHGEQAAEVVKARAIALMDAKA